MSSWPMVSLGNHLSQRSADVVVDPVARYRTTGVLSHGKGFFWRPEISGAETSYTKFTQLRTNDFVFSKLFGWEGALGVIPKAFDGGLVSSEFPVFDVDTAALDPAYLGYAVRRPDFYQGLATSGMGNRRQRVNPRTVLNSQIPLPPIDEQRRIAAWLGKIEDSIQQLGATTTSLNSTAAAAYRAAINSITEPFSATRRVEDVCSSIMDVVHPGQPYGSADRFVGLEYVEPNYGVTNGTGTVGGETGRKLRFRPGDVLYGYLRPYQNKVWQADAHGLCSVEQYALRCEREADGELLSHVLRGKAVHDAVVDSTNNLQLPRLGLSTLMRLQVPWPDSPQQFDVGIALLRRSQARALRIKDLAGTRERLVRSTLPSALNQVFGS